MPSAKIYTLEEILEFEDKEFKRKLRAPLLPGYRSGNLEVLFLSTYKQGGKHTTYACKCDCGNHVLVRHDTLIAGGTKSCGCIADYARKHNHRKLLVGDMVETIHKATRYKVVSCGDGRANGKWIFLCEKHGEFVATWRSVKRDHSNCPLCSNGGFKTTLPGTFYIFSVFDSTGEEVAIKFGITNKKTSHRKQELEYDTDYTLSLILEHTEEIGLDVLNFETKVKSDLGGKYLTKEEFGSGYTETLSVSLKEVLIDRVYKTFKRK